MVGYFKITLLCSSGASKKHSPLQAPTRRNQTRTEPAGYIAALSRNTRHAREKANIGHMGRSRHRDLLKRQTKKLGRKSNEPRKCAIKLLPGIHEPRRQRLAGEKKKLVPQHSERHDKTSPRGNACTITTSSVAGHTTNRKRRGIHRQNVLDRGLQKMRRKRGGKDENEPLYATLWFVAPYTPERRYGRFRCMGN